MPNEKTLNEKKAVVAQLAEKLKSTAGVLVDYSGITVAEDTEMRRAMRAAGVDYSVVKNTMMRFATQNVGFEALDNHLNGTTALAISATDPVAAARLINEYASKKDAKIRIKAGFVNGKIITEAEVKALANLPSKEVLVAQMLGTMIAPVSGLVNVLNANIAVWPLPFSTADKIRITRRCSVSHSAAAVWRNKNNLNYYGGFYNGQ